MAQENTAVNALIASVQNKPIDSGEEPAADLFKEPPKKAAPAPAAKPMPVRHTVQGHALAPKAPPPPFRKSGQLAAEGTPAPEILKHPELLPQGKRQSLDPVHFEENEPTPLPPPSVPATEPIERTPLPGALKNLQIGRGTNEEDAWYEKSSQVPRYEDRFDETYTGPEEDLVPRRPKSQAIWWIVAAFAGGLGIAMLLFWPEKTGSKKAAAQQPAAQAAPTQPTQPETPTPVASTTPAPTVQPVAAADPAAVAAADPAAVAAGDPAADPAAAAAAGPVAAALPAAEQPAPSVEPIAETAPAAPAVFSVRFESVPAGASVILVEDGQAIPLGKAPVDREIDPSRHNEVMFTLEGYASVILPVDEGEGMVTGYLDGTAPKKVEKKAVAKIEPKKAEPPKTEKAKADKPKVVKTPSTKPPAEKAIATTKPKKEKSPVASGRDGTLMIGAKPPCQIIIDGKNTGLTTPQRALDLSAGKHKVTLVNKEHGIKESFTVSIKAGQSTRVVKDLTSKM